jgi:hypothetical protein
VRIPIGFPMPTTGQVWHFMVDKKYYAPKTTHEHVVDCLTFQIEERIEHRMNQRLKLDVDDGSVTGKW